MKSLYLLFFCFAFFISCNSPQKYLNDAIDIMEKESLRKDSIDWITFREEVLSKGMNATIIEETYLAIRYALDQLGDKHSFLFTVKMQNKVFDDNNSLPFIRKELINSNIAYINIPSFMGNEKQAVEFAQNLQNIIEEFDSVELKGWIFDLRENYGGNMWPMLLGLGTVWENETLGYFADLDNNFTNWIYSNGSVYLGKDSIMTLSKTFELNNYNKKFAILIGSKTASSGEAVTIAFKGNSNTKFFGQNTKGLSTSNEGFELDDGSILILTTTILADRKMNVYGVPVKPDYLSLKAKEDAIKWIEN